MSKYLPIKFEDKFDTNDCPTYTAGVYKLTTTGCMARHKLPRYDEFLTKAENRKSNWELPNRIEREDRNLISRVATLFSQGYRLSPVDAERAMANQSDALAEFVMRITEELDAIK